MKIAELAGRLECKLEGAGEVELSGLNSLAAAGPSDLSFLANKRYAALMPVTAAGAVIVPFDWQGECPAELLRSENPDLAFALAADFFAPPVPEIPCGIHASAVIDQSAKIGGGAAIGPGAVVEAEAEIGESCIIGANAFVGYRARIGAGTRIYPSASIREYVTIGKNVTIHCGAVIGSDGFGYFPSKTGWRKIPQIGTVEIGDDCEIGANVTIDRARFGSTVIGRCVKIDNLCQIAHNVKIGDNTAMAAQVGISGSTVIGKNVQLGGQSGIAGHLHVGDNSVVGAQAGVTKDVPEGVFVSGYPAMPHGKARKMHAHMMRLPETRNQVIELGKRLEKIEALLDGK